MKILIFKGCHDLSQVFQQCHDLYPKLSLVQNPVTAVFNCPSPSPSIRSLGMYVAVLAMYGLFSCTKIFRGQNFLLLPWKTTSFQRPNYVGFEGGLSIEGLLYMCSTIHRPGRERGAIQQGPSEGQYQTAVSHWEDG